MTTVPAAIEADPRGHVEPVHAPEIEAESLDAYARGWPDGAQLKLLSRNAQTGALTGLLYLPRGYSRPEGHSTASTELLLLQGWLRLGDDQYRSYGYYDWAPAGATQEPWYALEDCELLFMPRTGAPDFFAGPGPAGEEGRLRIASEELPWTAPRTKDAPSGGRSKYLRRDPQTGEMSALVWAPPAWTHPKIEFHDTVEEMFQIVGDMTIETSGRLERGSYFWRPPWITHGPFHVGAGSIMYLYSDGPLRNYFTQDQRQTPESNLEQARRENQGG
jgi:hypothetical protein